MAIGTFVPPPKACAGESAQHVRFANCKKHSLPDGRRFARVFGAATRGIKSAVGAAEVSPAWKGWVVVKKARRGILGGRNFSSGFNSRAKRHLLALSEANVLRSFTRASLVAFFSSGHGFSRAISSGQFRGFNP